MNCTESRLWSEKELNSKRYQGTEYLLGIWSESKESLSCRRNADGKKDRGHEGMIGQVAIISVKYLRRN